MMRLPHQNEHSRSTINSLTERRNSRWDAVKLAAMNMTKRLRSQ
jgi:hypothetical protein